MSTILVCIISALISFIPILELKGAIPLAMSHTLWGDSALSPMLAWVSCCVGGVCCCFVIAAIFLSLRTKLTKFKFFDSMFLYIDKKINNWLNRKMKKSKNSHNVLKKCWIVFVFCALPLPFTGVWSAGALCALLKLNYFQSVASLSFANIFSAIVLTLFCTYFTPYIDLIFCVTIIITLLQILSKIIEYLCSKTKLAKLVKND